MADREEIRWKFQQIQQVIETSRLEHEKERENKLRNWTELYQQSIESRNTIMGGIGFVILLIVALSSIDDFYRQYLWVIVFLIIIGFIIFILFNMWLTRTGVKVQRIDAVYEKQVMEVIGVEGWFTGISLDETITSEHLVVLVLFMHDYTQALSYLLKNEYYKVHKQPHEEHENFRKMWRDVKNRYNSYEPLNELARNQIHNFIKTFEENEKEFNSRKGK